MVAFQLFNLFLLGYHFLTVSLLSFRVGGKNQGTRFLSFVDAIHGFRHLLKQEDLDRALSLCTGLRGHLKSRFLVLSDDRILPPYQGNRQKRSHPGDDEVNQLPGKRPNQHSSNNQGQVQVQQNLVYRQSPFYVPLQGVLPQGQPQGPPPSLQAPFPVNPYQQVVGQPQGGFQGPPPFVPGQTQITQYQPIIGHPQGIPQGFAQNSNVRVQTPQPQSFQTQFGQAQVVQFQVNPTNEQVVQAPTQLHQVQIHQPPTYPDLGVAGVTPIQAQAGAASAALIQSVASPGSQPTQVPAPLGLQVQGQQAQASPGLGFTIVKTKRTRQKKKVDLDKAGIPRVTPTRNAKARSQKSSQLPMEVTSPHDDYESCEDSEDITVAPGEPGDNFA